MSKILLLDDVQERLRRVANLLQRPETTILTAASGAEAVSIARAQHPDLVVVELEMEHGDGLAACRLLRSDRESRLTPALVLTLPDKEGEARRGGADHILVKPFEASAFVAEVGRIMALVQRAAPRVNVDTPVSFWRDGELASGRIVDLSRTGFFAATSEPQPLGARLEVAFTLPSPYSARRISGEAIVVRRSDGTPQGFGCRFFQVPSASHRVIEEFLERTGDRPRPGFGS